MVNVSDVANFLVLSSKPEEEDFMTNLRVNKLLYFIQGCYLSRKNEPLFEENFEAWKLGPVIPSIYNRYKVYGNNPITKESVTEDIELPRDVMMVITDVLREYGKYTTRKLVAITHESNTSWSKVFVEGQNNEISRDLIKDEFSKIKIRTLSEVLTQKQVYKTLPKELYDEREDTVWAI